MNLHEAIQECDRMRNEIQEHGRRIYELKSHIEGLLDGFHEVVQKLEAERDLYKPYYDALRARHNGYDEEFRKAVGCEEPCSPDAALDELIDEASSFSEEYPLLTVINNLKEERDKLTDTLMAAGFIGAGTQIIGDMRYKELLDAENELHLMRTINENLSKNTIEVEKKNEDLTNKLNAQTVENLKFAARLAKRDERYEELKGKIEAIGGMIEMYSQGDPEWTLERVFDRIMDIAKAS